MGIWMRSFLCASLLLFLVSAAFWVGGLNQRRMDTLGDRFSGVERAVLELEQRQAELLAAWREHERTSSRQLRELAARTELDRTGTPVPAVAAGLRVYLDTDRVEGWNEIDAIALLAGRNLQWAIAARASSSYSDLYAVAGPSPEPDDR